MITLSDRSSGGLSLQALLVGLVALSALAASPPLDAASETLSPRSVNTKYGQLRGALIYFKTYDRNFGAGAPPKSASASSSTSGSSSSSSSSQPGRGQASPSGGVPPLRPVEVFMGVPYATPPVGSLRFMPPVTPTHWRGVRLANRFGPVCPQRLPDINLRSASAPSSSAGSGGFRSNQQSSKGKSQYSSSSSNSGGASSSSNQLPEGRAAHLKRVLPFLRNQSEDCLYLNIYAPYTPGPSPSSSSASQRQSLPVVVFVHGDSYDWGTGNSYDGTILASFGNVIVVTLNYRLGIFGFLPALVDGASRGNYGLMDQVAALHWIQENIAEFGGDPHNVTLIGHGHGAACVNLLMISPMASSSLFSRVVLMSGSAMSPWAIARDAETYARHLGKVLNCPNYDNILMVDCLRKISIEDILSVDLKVPEHLTAFGPIVDGIVVPSEPRQMSLTGQDPLSSHAQGGFGQSASILSQGSPLSGSHLDRPLLAGMNGGGLPYDLLFGITRVESPFVFSAAEEKTGIDLQRRDRILRTLVRNLFDYHQQVIFLTLINEYTDWSRPIEHPINLFDSLVDILGDALVVSPLIQTGDTNAKLAAAASGGSGASSGPGSRRHHHVNTQTSRATASSSSSLSSTTSSSQSATGGPSSRTFFYVFSYQNDGNGFAQRLGCQHGEELHYAFGAPLAAELINRPLGHFSFNYSRQEIALSEAVMTYWTNFVKFGDPNIWPHELDSLGDRTKGRFENVYWPQYDTVQRKYLMIGMKPKVRDHYHSHRLSYWLHLVPRLQQQTDSDEQLYYYKHHLLPDHENPESYDGVVRQISFRFLSPGVSGANATSNHPSRIDLGSHAGQRPGQAAAGSGAPSNQLKHGRPGGNSSSTASGAGRTLDGSLVTSTPASDQPMVGSGLPPIANKTQATPIVMEQGSYSTALSVTIAIGCSLLILNMLIFAGVYYQLDKAKLSKNNSSTSVAGGKSNDYNQGESHLQQQASIEPAGQHTQHGYNQQFQENAMTLSKDELMMLSQKDAASYLMAAEAHPKTPVDELDPTGQQIYQHNFHHHPHVHYVHHQTLDGDGQLDAKLDQNCGTLPGSLLLGNGSRVICTSNTIRRSPKGRVSTVSSEHHASPSHVRCCPAGDYCSQSLSGQASLGVTMALPHHSMIGKHNGLDGHEETSA